MLPAVISVIVLFATGDPADGSTPAIERSLHTALGNEATITIHAAGAGVTEESLAASAVVANATLLCVVSWADHQRRVVIRCFDPPVARWSDREIRFDAADAPSERGRTVGFALASMVSDEALAASDRPRGDARAPAAPAPRAPAPAPAATPAESPPAVPPRPYRMAVDASAAASSGVGGYGGGFGGVFALRVVLAGPLSARVALGARTGAVPPAQATSRTIAGALGLAWQPWLDTQHRWSAGVRLSALLLRHELAHLSEDDPEPVHRSRFVPGLDAAVEGAFRVIEYASVVAAVGSEVAFGETTVYVKDRQVAAVPPLRVVGEAGLRVSF